MPHPGFYFTSLVSIEPFSWFLANQLLRNWGAGSPYQDLASQLFDVRPHSLTPFLTPSLESCSHNTWIYRSRQNKDHVLSPIVWYCLDSAKRQRQRKAKSAHLRVSIRTNFGFVDLESFKVLVIILFLSPIPHQFTRTLKADKTIKLSQKKKSIQ